MVCRIIIRSQELTTAQKAEVDKREEKDEDENEVKEERKEVGRKRRMRAVKRVGNISNGPDSAIATITPESHGKGRGSPVSPPLPHPRKIKRLILHPFPTGIVGLISCGDICLVSRYLISLFT